MCYLFSCTKGSSNYCRYISFSLHKNRKCQVRVIHCILYKHIVLVVLGMVKCQKCMGDDISVLKLIGFVVCKHLLNSIQEADISGMKHACMCDKRSALSIQTLFHLICKCTCGLFQVYLFYQFS